MDLERPHLRLLVRLAWPAGLLAACVLVGLFAADGWDDTGQLTASRTGVAIMLAIATAAIAAFHFWRVDGRPGLGPGVALATAALASAFALGLSSGDYRTILHKEQVTLYFAVGVATLVLGAVVASLPGRGEPSTWPDETTPDPLHRSRLALLGAAIIAMALANMLTGQIPLLAANVDASRFNSTNGLFYQVFVFLIGGMQWLVLTIAVTWLVRRGQAKHHRALLAGGLLVLGMIASRSIVLTVLVALVLVAAAVGRVGVGRLAIMGAVALAALGWAGSVRVQHSDPTGERRAFLASHGYHGITGIIVQSSTTSPWVFGEVLDTVPRGIPYQHGRFFFRDFRQQLPGHPLGRPASPDQWVTSAILDRDPTTIGGSPPTLVGGLYLDWGPWGIAIGCFLIGGLLVLVFAWARRARTIGALTLYGYLSAYIVLSAYNYISAKPLMLTVLILALATHRAELARRLRASTAEPAFPSR